MNSPHSTLHRTNPLIVLGMSKELASQLRSRSNIKRVLTVLYRELSRVHHPDNLGDPHKFAQIAEAYEELKDRDKLKFWVEALYNTADRTKELELSLEAHRIALMNANARLPKYLQELHDNPPARMIVGNFWVDAIKQRQLERAGFSKDDAAHEVNATYFDITINGNTMKVTPVREVAASGGPKNLEYETFTLGKDGCWWNRTLSAETNRPKRVRYEPCGNTETIAFLGLSALHKIEDWITPNSEQYRAIHGDAKSSSTVVNGWPPEMVMPLIASLSGDISNFANTHLFGIRTSGNQVRVVLFGYISAMTILPSPVE